MSRRDRPPPLTRDVRVAANCAAFAVVLFGALFVLSTQVARVRAQSPWGDDPYDAVASYAAIVVPFVAAITWVRSVRHRGPRDLPAHPLRVILRGCAVAVAFVLASVVADFAAVAVNANAEHRGAWLAPLLILLSLTGAVAIMAVWLLARAWRSARPVLRTAAPRDALEPDVLDDLAALAGAGLGDAVARAAASLNERLDVWRLSPRRHPLAACLTASLTFGVAFAGWRALREGAWASLAVAVVFAVLAAGAAALALTISVRFLGLLRRAGPVGPRDVAD